eukprot:3146480-Pleurochrysis_carterae.AAC.1
MQNGRPTVDAERQAHNGCRTAGPQWMQNGKPTMDAGRQAHNGCRTAGFASERRRRTKIRAHPECARRLCVPISSGGSGERVGGEAERGRVNSRGSERGSEKAREGESGEREKRREKKREGRASRGAERREEKEREGRREAAVGAE